MNSLFSSLQKAMSVLKLSDRVIDELFLFHSSLRSIFSRAQLSILHKLLDLIKLAGR